MEAKQLKLTFLLAVLMSMVGAKVFAYDFAVKNADGVTIYYAYTNNKTELAVSYRGSSSSSYSGVVNIPESVTYGGKTYSVTSIGSSAFYDCTGLTSVTIPNSVTSIESSAFSGCTGLTSVTIPNSVTSIGDRAFFSCTGLTSVTIGNSVTSIGQSAFEGCSGLTSVTIGNSVTSIGEFAFYGCTGLTEINVDENNPVYSSIDGVVFNKSQTELVCYPGGKQGAYTIPNSVTSIGNYAFSGCSGLASVTIPNSVTSIGIQAFWNCSGLISVTIPNSVTSIGEYAFGDCTGLTSITIPNSVTSIGNGAFSRCSGLTSVTIPNSVTSIGEWAFSWCSGLTEINVDENNPVYSSIDGVVFNKSQTELILCPTGKQGTYTIPNSVTSIGNYAFSGCSGLTSITIPNSVTSIGGYAFSRCSGLTSVTIPNSVTSIGIQVFAKCTSLTSVTIGNSVTSIGSSAFYGCSGLTDIYCHIEEPLTIESGIFNNVPRNTCTLHVPIGSKVKYQAANYGKYFLNIVEDLPTGIVSIDNSQSTIDNDVWFTLNGVRLNGKPTKAGIYIVNGKKVVVK